MEKGIVVIPKPSTMSWELISHLLRTAHQENVEKGVFMPYPFLEPEEIREKIESRNGVMFVAMVDDKLVGTGAVIILNAKLWCGSGQYGYHCFDAVLPEYAGKGVFKALASSQEEYVKAHHVDRIFFDTHEKNYRMIEVSGKSGYEFVEYRIRKDHNSVLMVKWFDRPPYSHFLCRMTFLKMKYMKKLRHLLGLSC